MGKQDAAPGRDSRSTCKTGVLVCEISRETFVRFLARSIAWNTLRDRHLWSAPALDWSLRPETGGQVIPALRGQQPEAGSWKLEAGS